jgi:hypothetical protein
VPTTTPRLPTNSSAVHHPQSSRTADALTPALYSRIVLRGPAQCIHTLDMLYARPERARHVRSLSVSPDSLSVGRATGAFSSSSSSAAAGARWGRGALPDAYAVSSAVLGVARYLEVLRCFVWDGEELPPYDDMWFALRILCVSLHLSLSLYNPPFFCRRLAVHDSSSSRRRWGLSCPRQTAMCVYSSPSLVVYPPIL